SAYRARMSVESRCNTRSSSYRASASRPERRYTSASISTISLLEESSAAERRFRLARAALTQIDEAQVGVPERSIGRERHHLLKLRFGARQLLLLQVGEAPGPGRERRVAPRLLCARGGRSPASGHQQQRDAAQVSRLHGREDDGSAARRQVYYFHAVISPPRPWRRIAVAASFLAAIVLVFVLNRRGQRAGGDPAVPQFHLTDVTAQVGINFVHHGPTLDPKLDNIAPLVGALGASVSVADVNDDGWPDLYFTNSRF